MARKIVARVIVAVLLGIAAGSAIGKGLAKDAAEGQALTLKEYIAEFENHKKHLTESELPMSVAIFSGVLMVVFVFGLYELLAFGVDKILEVVDRRRNVGMRQPGTPPPW